jgi:hypothetical protein
MFEPIEVTLAVSAVLERLGIEYLVGGDSGSTSTICAFGRIGSKSPISSRAPWLRRKSWGLEEKRRHRSRKEGVAPEGTSGFRQCKESSGTSPAGTSPAGPAAGSPGTVAP